MQKIYLIFLFSIILVSCYDKKDWCLDEGGSYNEKTGVCEKDSIIIKKQKQ